MATSLLHINSETSLCLQLLITVPFNLLGLLLYAEIFSHQVTAAKPQHWQYHKPAQKNRPTQALTVSQVCLKTAFVSQGRVHFPSVDHQSIWDSYTYRTPIGTPPPTHPPKKTFMFDSSNKGKSTVSERFWFHGSQCAVRNHHRLLCNSLEYHTAIQKTLTMNIKPTKPSTIFFSARDLPTLTLNNNTHSLRKILVSQF